MEKEPIFNKRRVCEPSAAGTGASTSGTSSVAGTSGVIDACDFESRVKALVEEALRAHSVARSSCDSGTGGKSGVGGDSSSGLGSSSSSSGAVGGMFVKIAYLVFLFCSIYCCIAWLAMVEPRIEMMVVLLFYLLYTLTVCQYFSLVVVGRWCTEIGRKK